MVYIYNYYVVILQNSTSFSEYVDLSNSHPYIVRLYEADESVSPSYKIIIEQQVITSTADLTAALYVLFAVHFVFNITYHSKVSDLYLFLQEVVFGMPSEVKKKSAAYTSFCVAIEASEKLDI